MSRGQFSRYLRFSGHPGANSLAICGTPRPPRQPWTCQGRCNVLWTTCLAFRSHLFQWCLAGAMARRTLQVKGRLACNSVGDARGSGPDLSTTLEFKMSCSAVEARHLRPVGAKKKPPRKKNDIIRGRRDPKLVRKLCADAVKICCGTAFDAATRFEKYRQEECEKKAPVYKNHLVQHPLSPATPNSSMLHQLLQVWLLRARFMPQCLPTLMWGEAGGLFFRTNRYWLHGSWGSLTVFACT